MYDVDNFLEMKAAIEEASNGKNTVLFDDYGMPSIMHIVEKEDSADLLTVSNKISRTHPAFIVGSTTYDKVYISQFINTVKNNRAYSLPMKDPYTNINFNTAVQVCRNKGTGWGLTPNSLWAAIALRCRANGFLPHGNNNYGKAIEDPSESGKVSYTYESGGQTLNGRTYTGSGPATWYDDGTIDGISDMNGNVWEWVGGLRTLSGEINIIPNANCINMIATTAGSGMAADSSEWKALNTAGTAISVGASGSLKFDLVDGKWTIKTAIANTRASSGHEFINISNGLGTSLPQILYELGLAPENQNGYGQDYFYENNTDGVEYMPLRSGHFGYLATSGVFYLYLYAIRSQGIPYLGFRSAFYG